MSNRTNENVNTGAAAPAPAPENTGTPAPVIHTEDGKPKTVKIKLYRDRDHTEDVHVKINGHRWTIQRGVEVEVPACVAEVLANQERMMETIMEFDAQHVKE